MTFRIAFKALSRNKMRTSLTMLGMIIGVAAVITLVALGNGAQSVVEEQIKAGGTNMITVMAGNMNQGGVRGGQGTAISLSVDDANAIRDEVQGVQYVAVQVRTQQQAIAGSMNWPTRVTGTDVDLPLIRAWPVKSGSFFSAQDVTAGNKVCVLGNTVNTNLFGEDGDGTGQTIRIRNQPFRVIGVMSPKGANMGEDLDDQILAPYTTVQKRLIGQPNIQSINVSAAAADATNDVADRIALLLRDRHKIRPGQDDDFMARTLEEMAAMRTATMETMTTLLAGIAGVSLVVGGIGIMNIMLVSVTERTKEIGLRRALGAKRVDVLRQFVAEALSLSLAGGAMGVALGTGSAYALSAILQWATAVPPMAIGMSFGFAALAGVVFGYLPARKAAALMPTEALRYE